MALVDSKKTSIPPTSPSSSGNKRCAHCKRRGHIRESCFLWLETPDGSKWAAKNPQKAAKVLRLEEKLSHQKNKGKITNSLKTSHDTNNIDNIQHGAWVMAVHALVSDNTMENDIVLDTGASNHIFCDEKLFVSISPTNKTVSTASGQSISVSGIGSARFRVYSYFDNNKSKEIKIDDVWYVPSCTKNLVSGSRLISKGFGIM